jgi:hypothetical protein
MTSADLPVDVVCAAISYAATLEEGGERGKAAEAGGEGKAAEDGGVSSVVRGVLVEEEEKSEEQE